MKRRFLLLLQSSPARVAKRVVIAVIGGTVLLVGLAMIILPGPAVMVIPAGLAILATEFVWAARLLHRIKERAKRVLPTRAPRAATAQPPPPHH